MTAPQAQEPLRVERDFQRKRADDRVAAYKRQAVELDTVRDQLESSNDQLVALRAALHVLVERWTSEGFDSAHYARELQRLLSVIDQP